MAQVAGYDIEPLETSATQQMNGYDIEPIDAAAPSAPKKKPTVTVPEYGIPEAQTASYGTQEPLWSRAGAPVARVLGSALTEGTHMAGNVLDRFGAHNTGPSMSGAANQYQNTAIDPHNEHPIETGVGTFAGGLVPMLAGGETIGAMLPELGVAAGYGAKALRAVAANVPTMAVLAEKGQALKQAGIAALMSAAGPAVEKIMPYAEGFWPKLGQQAAQRTAAGVIAGVPTAMMGGGGLQTGLNAAFSAITHSPGGVPEGSPELPYGRPSVPLGQDPQFNLQTPPPPLAAQGAIPDSLGPQMRPEPIIPSEAPQVPVAPPESVPAAPAMPSPLELAAATQRPAQPKSKQKGVTQNVQAEQASPEIGPQAIGQSPIEPTSGLSPNGPIDAAEQSQGVLTSPVETQPQEVTPIDETALPQATENKTNETPAVDSGVFAPPELLNTKQINFPRSGTHNLSELVSNDEIFRKHPDLKNVKVILSEEMPIGEGEYDPGSKTIMVHNRDYFGPLVHEMTHAVQHAEGREIGSNIVNQNAPLSDPASAYKQYLNNPSEQEASKNQSVAEKNEAMRLGLIKNESPPTQADMPEGIVLKSGKYDTGGRGDAYEIGDPKTQLSTMWYPGKETIQEAVAKLKGQASASENSQATEIHGNGEQSSGAGENASGGSQSAAAESGQGVRQEEVKPEPEKTTSIKNSVVDQERIDRGLEPIEKIARKGWEQVWDEAKQKIEKNPDAGMQKVQDYIDHPRAFANEVDQVLVEHQRITTQNEYDKTLHAMHDAISSGDEETAAEFRLRSAGLHDQLQQIDSVAKHGGSATGGTLNARKMMIKEDFSLARMTMEREADLGGKPLTPTQYAEVKAAHDRISELEKALSAHQDRLAAVEKKVTTMRVPAAAETARPKGYGSRNKLVTTADAEVARIKLKEAMAHLNVGVDPSILEPLTKLGLYHFEAGAREFGRWSKEMISDLGEKAKPFLPDMWQESQQKFKDAQQQTRSAGALKAYKTRTANREAELKAKLERGDFATKERKPMPLDEPALKAKAALERAKQDWEAGRLKAKQSQRTRSERWQDTFIKWRRAFILSSPNIFAKLGSAAAQRMGITPVEEAIGGAIGKAIPSVASKAKFEGGFHAKAEAQAIADAFTKGMQDSWKNLHMQKSDLEALHDEKTRLPPTAIDYLGYLHAALKAPVKRAEFSRRFAKGIEWEMRQGNDVSDPAVQIRTSIEAYKYAQRSIFMQDNRLVSAYKRALSALEQVDKKTGHAPLLSRTAATLTRIQLPIVKVPTNIIGEVFTNVFGSVTGSARLARAYGKGIENLHPEEADLIMHQLKKGSLGAAVLALGYFGSNNIGGFWQPGEKRDPKDVKAGSIRAFGRDLPPYLIHSPLGLVLQLGASVRRIADSKERKKDTESQGLAIGSAKALLGLAEEVPFAREMTETAKLLNPREAGKSARNEVKGLVVPSALQWTANQFDKPGNPFTTDVIPRQADTLRESIQSGIPGLRNQLPAYIPNKRKGAWSN